MWLRQVIKRELQLIHSCRVVIRPRPPKTSCLQHSPLHHRLRHFHRRYRRTTSTPSHHFRRHRSGPVRFAQNSCKSKRLQSIGTMTKFDKFSFFFAFPVAFGKNFNSNWNCVRHSLWTRHWLGYEWIRWKLRVASPPHWHWQFTKWHDKHTSITEVQMCWCLCASCFTYSFYLCFIQFTRKYQKSSRYTHPNESK